MKNTIIRFLIALCAAAEIIGGLCLNVGILSVHADAPMTAEMFHSETLESSNAEPVKPLGIESGIYEDTHYYGAQPMEYRLYIPEKATTNMPLIVWLHGISTVNRPYVLNNAGAIQAAKDLGENRFIILQPCTREDDWTGRREQVNLLVDELIQKLHIDPDRLILAGYSLGAMGAWYYASLDPEMWAAIIPAAGQPTTGYAFIDAPMSIWALWGDLDGYALKSDMLWTVDACIASGTHKDVRYTEMENTEHNSETAIKVFSQEVFDWAFAQSK